MRKHPRFHRAGDILNAGAATVQFSLIANPATNSPSRASVASSLHNSSTRTPASHDIRTSGVDVITDAYHTLRASYIFLRNLIDALRMVRGHARDLEIPAAESDEFEFLARRLGYASDTRSLADDLEQACRSVQELGRVLDTDPD